MGGAWQSSQTAHVLARFFARPRAAQACILCLGVVLFWSVPLGATGILPLSTFIALLAAGNIVFACGLLYDVLLIKETQDLAAVSPAPVAELLTKRISWRWVAFVLFVLGTVATAPGCVLYSKAVKQGAYVGEQADRTGSPSQTSLWVADVWFGGATLVFTIGYLLQAVDAIVTLSELAKLRGDAPRWCDETHGVLYLFGGGLVAVTVANWVIILAGSPQTWVLATAIAFASPGLAALTFASFWLLRIAVREFNEEGGGREANARTPLLGGRSRA